MVGTCGPKTEFFGAHRHENLAFYILKHFYVRNDF
jgi:hypothetical protein